MRCEKVIQAASSGLNDMVRISMKMKIHVSQPPSTVYVRIHVDYVCTGAGIISNERYLLATEETFVLIGLLWLYRTKVVPCSLAI